MSMARLVIMSVVVEGRSKSEVARDYGVSRRWVQKLVARYVAEGEAAFEPRSRRPRTSPHALRTDIEEEIVELRKHLSGEGLDAGAATISFHLAARHDQVPSVSTIWRVLRRRGFVVAQPHKRPRSSIVRFCADQPNERWQADITHWALADGSDVEILNIIDDHSRLVVASDARASFRAADVVATFRQAGTRYGLPASLLTDNAAVFTGSYRSLGWVALERELVGLGISLRHSRPYHPQTCGKVERFHQTLKRWLARRRRAASVVEAQAQLDAFASYYNDCRPHRALGRRTPRWAYDARPRAGPTGAPLELSHYRLRRDKVYPSGVITLRHNSRLHHIGLGRRYGGMSVLVLVDELRVRVLSEDGELIRALTLDPSRDYQRQK